MLIGVWYVKSWQVLILYEMLCFFFFYISVSKCSLFLLASAFLCYSLGYDQFSSHSSCLPSSYLPPLEFILNLTLNWMGGKVIYVVEGHFIASFLEKPIPLSGSILIGFNQLSSWLCEYFHFTFIALPNQFPFIVYLKTNLRGLLRDSD